jgi:hypothetical protein
MARSAAGLRFAASLQDGVLIDPEVPELPKAPKAAVASTLPGQPKPALEQ